MLVEAFFSTLVSFCLVQLLHNTVNFDRSFYLNKLHNGVIEYCC